MHLHVSIRRGISISIHTVLTDWHIEAVYVTNKLVGPDLRSFKVCVYVAFTLLQKRLL